jgi:hypothetical protein
VQPGKENFYAASRVGEGGGMPESVLIATKYGISRADGCMPAPRGTAAYDSNH